MDPDEYADRDETCPRFPASPIPAANPAQVPLRSPLRYPGGKTWLLPHVRFWLRSIGRPAALFEPFCGGAGVSLMAAAEGLAGLCSLRDADPDIAAFWRAVLFQGPALAGLVQDFRPTPAAAAALADSLPPDAGDLERGFRTLALNRLRHGGILAPGAAFAKAGENGKGLASRWYPETLARRIVAAWGLRRSLSFGEGDGLAALEDYAGEAAEALLAGADASAPAQFAVFADPPYPAAGRRLYGQADVDPARLFRALDQLRQVGSEFLLTYEATPGIARLVQVHGFAAVEARMRTRQHRAKRELVITPRAVFG